MAYPLTLTKVSSQATPYFWLWTTRGTRTVCEKFKGSTQFTLEGVDDTDVLRKINAHEGELSAASRPVH